MTVEEIFNKLASHMVEGIMYHDDFAKAYDFLGFYGLAKCHDYHHFTEEANYRELSHYYATHYFKLIQLDKIPQPEIIPQSWYNYTTHAVDVGTKRQAVKELMGKWVNWEKETKKLYEEMYLELTNLREIAAAMYIKKYLCDVDNELEYVEKKFIKFETLGYDISTLVGCQESMYEKSKSQLKTIFE